MRIAIFHNYMDNIGGAEMVVLTLARELKADVYTTVANQENIRKMGFDIKIHTIGWIPKNAPWRQQCSSLRLRLLSIRKKYDFFIIAGDWAVSAAVRHKPNLWYVHSPIREIYDLYPYAREHIVPGNLFPNLSKYAFDVWVHINRFLNRRYVRHAQMLVANSKNTAARVKSYLHRDAVIIHPPVDTTTFYFENVGDYWLSVNRLIAPKRIEIQLEAFRSLPGEKLIVVGTYEDAAHFLEYKQRLEKMRPENVTFLSHVEWKELRTLYANCRGVISTALDEDFGLTAVEAMASGKPVIAPNAGGYKETVIDGVTGVLVDDMRADTLVHAIQKVGSDPISYRAACFARAKEFDTVAFVRKIKKEIDI